MLKTILPFILLIVLSSLRAQDYTFYALSGDRNVHQPVYLCHLNGTTGEIVVRERYGGVVGGNYYALSSDRNHLLVTSKNKAWNQGGVVQFDVAKDGRLTYVKEVLEEGDLPCHVSFTPDMKYVLSANYADDEILLYPFTRNEIGSIKDQVVKEDGSRGHYISTGPSRKYVYAVFLGLDRVFNYTILDSRLTQNENQAYFSLPEGYGPRHMVFHPQKPFAYIVNEYHSSVTACRYQPETGVLSKIQEISMLPDGFTGKNSAAAIRIHPEGKFLYASNRGHNSIVVFSVCDEGTLTLVEHESRDVQFPRDFNISPDGKYMIVGNQRGHSIMSLTIDRETGALENTGEKLKIAAPLAFEFLPE